MANGEVGQCLQGGQGQVYGPQVPLLGYIYLIVKQCITDYHFVGTSFL